MFGAFFGEVKSYECNFCNSIMKPEKFRTFMQFLLMSPHACGMLKPTVILKQVMLGASQYCGFQDCCERVKEMMAIIYCTFLSCSFPDSGCTEFCKRSGVMAPE